MSQHTTTHTTMFETRPHFAKMLAACATLDPLVTAVICPEEATAMAGAMEARDAGLITPVLVGNRAAIETIAAEGQFDISGLRIVDADTEENAAHAGVDLVAAGEAEALMKGFIHSDTYLAAVIRRENGLRTKNRTSHCFVMDIPGWPRPMVITDAALNVAPDVKNRMAITQNAIHLARAIGIEEPKVAVMSAVESPNPAIPSSVDARAIAEGDYEGGIVDGPFAMDNAVNEEAARMKGITSPVAGKADVLVVPTIEAGNMLFKALTFMAGSETGGLVVGAKAPVILTSRADSAEARIASCAIAVLYGHYLNK